tara:strand:- start:5612 stop:6307 length:696 start_codon:yes stop_codon:yes gene_type:complete
MYLKKLGCIIFARSNSKRLNEKVLKEINGIPLILIVYSRVKKIFPKEKIVIATSRNKFDDRLVKICKKNKINFFRGSLDNVYERSIQCCKKFNFDSFMRVCSDRPFFYYELAIKMKKIFVKGKYDIVTNVFPKSYPRGLACEFIKLKTMNNVRKKMLNKSDKEHIINYFYKNSKNFAIRNYKSKLNKNNQNLNLSIDNLRDFKKVHKILEKNSFNTTVSTKTALNYLMRLS